MIYDFDRHAERTGIPSLLAAMRDEGIAFKDLDTKESSLEDIFVSLIRDGAK
jgi:ABC-2 type transport system ATP-binding protein